MRLWYTQGKKMSKIGKAKGCSSNEKLFNLYDIMNAKPPETCVSRRLFFE